MNFKDVILGSDSLDLKVKRISDLFETDEFLSEALYSKEFLDVYIPFAILVLNTVDAERSPPYTSQNEIRTFMLKSLNKFIFKNVTSEDFIQSLHRVLEFDNLYNVIMSLKIFASLNKSMSPEMFERHVSVVVELINSIFSRLEGTEEKEETSFFTLVQIFGYVSDVIQRQNHTEKKIDGIIHRAVTFFRLYLEHRRVIDLIKYNKGLALEMISTLSKLFKISSESKIFSFRNDSLNLTIFELAKFSLFYCPTDAVELRKELFYYIFKILLRNKDMYLPKIEEFFDIRFFYLDEAYLINIKGLIGLTDMASVFSDNLSRRIPYELQRRTGEILESNLMMIREKKGEESSSPVEVNSFMVEDEYKLKYEKSLKFHLEIVYEVVNSIYKQQVTLKKFAFQKAEQVDFTQKQFLMISRIIQEMHRMMEEVKHSQSEVVQQEILPLVKSIFLSLSKPLKEMADTPVETTPVFELVLDLIISLDVEEKDIYTKEILFFFSSSGESQIVNRLCQQTIRDTKRCKLFLDILKRPNMPLQIVVNCLIKELVKKESVPKGVFVFLAEVYSFNSGLFSRKSMYSLVEYISQKIHSSSGKDHKLLLFLLVTFNIKNDKGGSLHVFFYKKLHSLVQRFYSFYCSTLDPIYLDIIFSFPININAVASEWRFFLNPIRSALGLRNEITVKAITTFIHIIEGSKSDILQGEEIFQDVFELLDDQRFVIPCSQLLGRLKSFHKKYLTSTTFFYDTSFKRNVFFLKGQNIKCDDVLIKAIEFLRGSFVLDTTRRIYDRTGVVAFKKTRVDVKRSPKEVKVAFRVIRDFLLKVGRDEEMAQYVYDSILALLTITEDGIHEEAFTLLSSEFLLHQKIVVESNVVDCNSDNKSVVDYNDLDTIPLRALLESFENSSTSFSTRLLHYVLDHQMASYHFSLHFLTSLAMSKKMSKASFYGLNALLLWENLPSSSIPRDLKMILDSLLLYVGRQKSFSKDLLLGVDHLINRKDTLSCVSFIFKWAVDNLALNDKMERIFCKEIIKSLFMRYDKLFIAMFTEKLKGFFYALSDLRDIDVFFTKVDLFVFFVKNSRLFSEKETVVFVKAYFYYILSCNFFIFNVPQEKYTNKECDISYKRKDLIKYLFYTRREFYDSISEDERYYYYLVNEILYMHLAFSKKKEVARLPFDFAFSNLPFGYNLTLKRLLLVNETLFTSLLREKYEECFSSTLSVQVVEKMLCIFSVIEMPEDDKLLNFISKIFSECQTQGESLLVAEDPESSIFAKTFELSLKYPEQSTLHRSILCVAYPWLYNSSRDYIPFKDLLKYIEKNSFLTFPLLVRECVNEPIYQLAKYVVTHSVSFRNFSNNLSSVFVEECLENNPFIFDFLQLIDFEVTPPSITAALKIYSEMKMKNKDGSRIKKFIAFSINRFSENDLNVLFKIDPLLKLNNSCGVKMFTGLSTKSLYGCLLKSVNKKDVKSFENLVRFYGDQSWMLIDLFVEVNFYSSSMIEYCRTNLSNVNIRSFLLYYLCTFEPLPEYFDLLLNLSFEERKYTLYCLRRIVDTRHKNSMVDREPAVNFEDIILSHLRSEVRYKTNIHILYPLLSYDPSLLTPSIARELCGIVHRLLNTFVQFHQKIGSQLFDALYHFYSTDNNEMMGNLYNLLFVNFIHSKKSSIISFFESYNLLLDFDYIQIYPESLNPLNVLSFLECELASTKPEEYKVQLSTFLLKATRTDWWKYPLKASTLKFFNDHSLVKMEVVNKEVDVDKVTLLNSLSLTRDMNKHTLKRIIREEQQNTTFLKSLLKEMELHLPNGRLVDLIIDILQETPYTLIKEMIMNIILENKANISQSISLLSNIEEDEQLALSFFVKNRFVQPGVLSSLNGLFYRGCISPDESIRRKYIQLLSEILPYNTLDRLKVLFEIDWSGAEKLPFIFAVLLLDCYDTLELHVNGSCTNRIYPGVIDFGKDLVSFLFISQESCLSLISEILRDTPGIYIPSSVDEKILGDKLMYSIIRNSNIKECNYKGGPRTWYHLLSISTPSERLLKFREMGMKDYSYGCLRSLAKFPETMQASLFQQLGKYKEAQAIYEDLQSKCCESKVSFYEDEYDHILKEWVECAKEMQQWDICYTLGKFKGDTTLSADSLFFTSNFNIPTDRENFSNMVSLMENGVKKSFYNLFYELFYSPNHTPSSETFIKLLCSIVEKIYSGPQTREYINYYATLIQIVLEMHDTTNLFTLRPDTEERINGLIYSWEDKEPFLESQYETLLLFSTWRRHFWRRVEGYSSGLEGELEAFISPGGLDDISKSKEMAETVLKFRKAMGTKGNNGLGRNANFLALAAYKKGYYDNALFLLREVFELPSIKILDAYRKVVYELLCFYEIGDYKMGLDLANSTNIVHFSDEQSSNIFRLRGMFSSKIGSFEETEKLYFQAIQFFSSSENFFYYNTLLIKHYDIFRVPNPKIEEEVISSTLQGLSTSSGGHSKELILQFILILKTRRLSYDLSIFKSLIKSVNLNYFIFFIPQLVELLTTDNFEYSKIILQDLLKNFSQPIITQLRILFSSEIDVDTKRFSEFSDILKTDDFSDFLCLFNDLWDDKYLEEEMVGILDGIVHSFFRDSKEEMPFDRLIELSGKSKCSYKMHIQSPLTLSESLSILLSIQRELKNFLKAASPKEINLKIQKINLVISGIKNVALFGSYNKFSKDYSDTVFVESFDTPKATGEVYLIGSDGRYYKYEITKYPGSSSHSLYNLLALEINSSYKLRTREASFLPVQGEEIIKNVFVEVFDSNFDDFEKISAEGGFDHLVEFVKETEIKEGENELKCEEVRMEKNKKEEELSLNDIEKSILRILKDDETPEIQKGNVVGITGALRLLKERYTELSTLSTTRLSHKTRLRCYTNVLKKSPPSLSSFFAESCEDSFSYFMQRNSFSKSFALNLSLNNLLLTKTKDPENDVIQLHTGRFFRKSLSEVTLLNLLEKDNSLYIPPLVQEFVGVENIEGPILSCLFFSSEQFLKSESVELSLRLFMPNFDTLWGKIKERLERVVGVENNDHNVVNLLNEWTDVGIISKNDVLENTWM